MSAIEPASLAALERVLRRESVSLLSYVGDAFPWTTTAGGPDLKTLNQLIRQEKQAVTDLGRYLVRRKATPPFIGSYPAWFTSWNFIAISALLPKLSVAQRHLVGELEADVAKVSDAGAKLELERVLAVKKMTLAALESLAAAPAVA